jgi:hypothetical protein
VTLPGGRKGEVVGDEFAAVGADQDGEVAVGEAAGEKAVAGGAELGPGWMDGGSGDVDAGFWMLDTRFFFVRRTMEGRGWILDARCLILDAGLR